MVIQRWQSVLLLVSVILMSCFSFLSLGQIQTEFVTYNFTACGIYAEGIAAPESMPVSTWYIFAISILSVVLSLIAIFTFKNLRLQKRLCLLTVLAIICVIIACAIIAYQQFGGANIEWSSIVCAPFISLISVIMAYQRINRDQKLIMASERLR